MAKIKLTKSAVDAAETVSKDYELRDTIVPGFLCKVTAHGRKVFMLQYRTNWGERRKPKIGQFGELTVEQARSIAQDWLADVRKGNDPSAAKLAARMAPTVKELCEQFIEEYSKPRKVDTYQGYIDRHIIPAIGKMKVPDLTRADITTLMKNKRISPSQPTGFWPACARCSTWPKCGATDPTAPIHAVTSLSTGRMARRDTSSTTSWRAFIPIWTGRMLKGWNIRP